MSGHRRRPRSGLRARGPLAGAVLLAAGLWPLAACRREPPSGDSPPATPATAPGPARSSPPPGLRDVSRLPASEELPDPLLAEGGGRVTTPQGWQARRAQIVRLLARTAYGALPGAGGPVRLVGVTASEVLQGAAEKRHLRLAAGPGGRLQIPLGVLVPSGPGPFATILHIDHRGPFGFDDAQALLSRGYLLVGYDPGFLDPDQPGVTGPAEAAFPQQDWGTLAIWAWGALRVMDYLQTWEKVDRRRVVVAGHSRSGKAALLAGALDPRFALVAPMGSGCGGAAAYRVKGPGAETLTDLVRNFPHWLSPRMRAFAGHEQHLPFDQHFVLALVAPRALLLLDAAEDRWANLPGTAAALEAARPVFDLLGAGDKLQAHLRAGQHAVLAEDWRALADFAEQVLPR